MSVVISDASCLILFTNIDRLDILKSLFDEIWATTSVKEEYKLPLPDFVTVHDPLDTGRRDALKLILDQGEASAIALAAETPDSKIIIDEKKGRRIATQMGLDVTGTVGVLVEAAAVGLIRRDQDLATKLDLVGFRLSARLRNLLEDIS